MGLASAYPAAPTNCCFKKAGTIGNEMLRLGILQTLEDFGFYLSSASTACTAHCVSTSRSLSLPWRRPCANVLQALS